MIKKTIIIISILAVAGTGSFYLFRTSSIKAQVSSFENGTILLVKPIATGVGDGRYEAGDIVEIREGKEKIGGLENVKLLPIYYDGVLSARDKELWSESELDKDENIIKRRKYGLDYTAILSSNDILKARNFEKLDHTPEVTDLSIIESKAEAISVIEIPFYLAWLETMRGRLQPDIAYAQAEDVKVIDPDQGAGYNYASLNAWEAAEQADLTAGAGTIAIAKCRSTGGTADITATAILSWTTSATAYIKIWTDPDESYRHAGVWDASKYRLEVSNDEGLYNFEDFVRIEGLQIKITADSSTSYGIRNSTIDASSDIRISHNIFEGVISDAINAQGILTAASGNYKIWNNIIYDFGLSSSNNRGIGASAGNDIYLFNNSVIRTNVCVRSGATMVLATNNLTQDCIDGYSSTFDAYSDYNLSDIVGDTPAGGGNDKSGLNAAFLNASSSDYHLASGDTAAKDSGVDLSATTTIVFDDDIDGDTRTGTWDMGADEYVSAAAPAVDEDQTDDFFLLMP